MSAKSVLWYNECLLKVTDELLTMWPDSGKLPLTVSQGVPQNKTTMFKGTNITDCNNISNASGMSALVNQNESTAKKFVSAMDDRSQQEDSRAMSSAVSNAKNCHCIIFSVCKERHSISKE